MGGTRRIAFPKGRKINPFFLASRTKCNAIQGSFGEWSLSFSFKQAQNPE